jgi:hypothetical protein
MIVTAKEFSRNPEHYITLMKRGETVTFSDYDYSLVPTNAVIWAGDDEEAGDMVSLTKRNTGIHNTLFASTKGYASERHGPRIKIAIDPATSLVASGKQASMRIYDFAITGEHMPPALVGLVTHFIELNRAALLDYWDGKIATDEFLSRLRPIDYPRPPE